MLGLKRPAAACLVCGSLLRQQPAALQWQLPLTAAAAVFEIVAQLVFVGAVPAASYCIPAPGDLKSQGY